VFLNQSLDSVQFGGPKPATSFQTDRLKPELGLRPIAFHMYVRRLVPVARVEEEPVRSDPQHRRHVSKVPQRYAYDKGDSRGRRWGIAVTSGCDDRAAEHKGPAYFSGSGILTVLDRARVSGGNVLIVR
jgi:hypothetical protein